MENDFKLTRRALLGGAALLAASACVPRRAKEPEEAAELPPVPRGSYPFQVGSVQGFVISDGSFTVPPHPTFGSTVSEKKVKSALKAEYRPQDKITIHMNGCYLRSGAHHVLIDSGSGGAMGPASGKFLSNLSANGVNPRDITAVVITHAHMDHIGGLLKDGQFVYPNAGYFMLEEEWKFWMEGEPNFSKSKLPVDAQKGMIQSIKAALGTLGPKITRVKSGADVVPGVVIQAAPGHTPGHAAYRITSGTDQLLVIGDTATHDVLALKYPEWPFIYDIDPKTAVKTRKKILSEAAADRIQVLSYHLSYPGMGFVGREGSGFRWHPSIWEWA